MTNRTFKIGDVVQDAKATSTEIQQSMQHLTELRKLMRDALMDVEQALHQAQNCSDDAQFNSEMEVDTPQDILPVDTQFMNYHVDDNQVIED
mgnify:FL=1